MTEEELMQGTIEKIISSVDNYPPCLGAELLLILKDSFEHQISKYLSDASSIDDNLKMKPLPVDDRYSPNFLRDSQRFSDEGQRIAAELYRIKYNKTFGGYPIETIELCPSIYSSLSKKLKEDTLTGVRWVEYFIRQAIMYLNMHFDGDIRVH